MCVCAPAPPHQLSCFQQNWVWHTCQSSDTKTATRQTCKMLSEGARIIHIHFSVVWLWTKDITLKVLFNPKNDFLNSYRVKPSYKSCSSFFSKWDIYILPQTFDSGNNILPNMWLYEMSHAVKYSKFCKGLNFQYLALVGLRSIYENPLFAQLLKKSPVFYGARRLLTRAHYWSVSWATWIQPVPPRPISLRSIPLSSSHLHRGLPSASFPQVFLPKCCIHVSFHEYCMPCSSHPPGHCNSNYI